MARISAKDIKATSVIRSFLSKIGEDPDRDGIFETPKRFQEALKHMLGGYDRNFSTENKLFNNHTGFDDIILLKNIDFFSLCEHHLLPFYGYAHIGYVPGEKIFGISKLARAVDIYSRRLQDQESLSSNIIDALEKHGKPKGVAVLIEARHLCNAARGVEKKVSLMTTCSFSGVFKRDKSLQNNFLQLIEKRHTV